MSEHRWSGAFLERALVAFGYSEFNDCDNFRRRRRLRQQTAAFRFLQSLDRLLNE
jgi:hypothetical protein